MKNSLLLVGIVVLVIYLWLQSQSTTRGLTTGKATAKPKAATCSLASALQKLLGGSNQQAAPKGSAGGGSGSGSGASTAAGARACNKTPGSAFCGCASCLAYAGKDSNGNEIYQKSCGSLVYSDGSPATQADIACNEGACKGTVCNPPVCNPQCVQTAPPSTSSGASGGCAGSGCFCGGGLCGGCV